MPGEDMSVTTRPYGSKGLRKEPLGLEACYSPKGSLGKVKGEDSDCNPSVLTDDPLVGSQLP